MWQCRAPWFNGLLNSEDVWYGPLVMFWLCDGHADVGTGLGGSEIQLRGTRSSGPFFYDG
ncbi:hypothetical protein THTE_0035 [Thermogutta terrifontis]|uniref:Uncharacterized protein n=1 Tax=Thermogutta terrifontis TaxID=1331910 RepID=A0A286R9K4_9BACT|nr:hypothetical protein THTE_0035 [Thermogutta terrifontis]